MFPGYVHERGRILHSKLRSRAGLWSEGSPLMSWSGRGFDAAPLEGLLKIKERRWDGGMTFKLSQSVDKLSLQGYKARTWDTMAHNTPQKTSSHECLLHISHIIFRLVSCCKLGNWTFSSGEGRGQDVNPPRENRCRQIRVTYQSESFEEAAEPKENSTNTKGSSLGLNQKLYTSKCCPVC